ncbi:MAG: DUF481 domain-containing protein [Opitutaceae bacterium]|nr:DUF481 domain-containing protein [Opitutaceae bacterium]
MNLKYTNRALVALTIALLGAVQLSADVVETKSGARIVGKVVKVDGGSVVVSTDYAGTVTIKQADVSAITTDEAIAVRLASGTRVEGRVSGTADALQIASRDGTINTSVDKVAASWAAGGKDPQIAALERSWAFEAGVDITGRSGNKSQLGTAANFRATLAGPTDALVFYTGYDRQETDNEVSADQFKAGVDYTNAFSGKYSWYVRNEAGFDRIKDIDFYDVAGAGLGYDFVKSARQTLTGRFGLSFRSENYGNPATEDLNAVGLDLGLNNEIKFKTWSMVNRLSVVPAFNDFGNYRLAHESYAEMPLVSTNWRIRIGLTNDYNSKPGPGIEKMDTGYFTRLVLNWK